MLLYPSLGAVSSDRSEREVLLVLATAPAVLPAGEHRIQPWQW